MSASDFIWLLVGGSVTGLAGAAIYAAVVARFDPPSLRRITAALQGRGGVE